MMLQGIIKPVAGLLEEFGAYYDKQFKPETEFESSLISHLQNKKGKLIRPALVFLAAGLYKRVNDRTFLAAALVEMLHNASLVHDDIVDNAKLRRNNQTFNARWDDGTALLFGDYLISRLFRILSDNGEYRFLEIISRVFSEMVKGELLQKQKTGDLELDEIAYNEIIYSKSASLISACCELGAISVGACENEVKILRQFGEKIGIAFQIKDDILDYIQNPAVLGKPALSDLVEKKLTLPLIYSYSKAHNGYVHAIEDLFRKEEIQDDSVEEILNFVKHSGGINYAAGKAHNLIGEAKALLANFESSENKTALLGLSDYIIGRMM